MHDLTKTTDETESDVIKDELTILKERADFMRVKYHVNIGLDALREKVNAALEDAPEPKTTPVISIDAPTYLHAGATVEEIIAGYRANEVATLSTAQKRNQAMKECNRLVRIQVTCMNPVKRDWPGETIEVGNSVVGTFKKYIPFAVSAGYHVPHIIYQALKERDCQIFVNGLAENGTPIKRAKLIKEFAVEILPSLTEAEIKELAQRQLMASGAAE